MVHIKTRHYDNGLNKHYSVSTMHHIYKHSKGTYTMRDVQKYISEHAQYGIRIFLFEQLKEKGSVIWYTETDVEAECKYPDRGPCDA